MNRLPVQLEARGKHLRRFAHAVGRNLRHSDNPRLAIIAPPSDRHEITAVARIICEDLEIGRCCVADTESDIERRVFLETNHDPILVPDGAMLSPLLQTRLVKLFKNPGQPHPPMFLVIIEKDPGDLMRNRIWSLEFRELFIGRQFHLPTMADRTTTPVSRYEMFHDIFREVSGRAFTGEIRPISEEAEQLIRLFFKRHVPQSMGSYVKLAAECISSMMTQKSNVVDTETVKTVFGMTTDDMDRATPTPDLSEVIYSLPRNDESAGDAAD